MNASRNLRRWATFLLRAASVVSAAAMIGAFIYHGVGSDDSYVEIKRASLALSPDGRQAIVATSAGRLFLADLESGVARPFRPQLPANLTHTHTKGSIALSDPAFSPDGKEIAFAAASDLWIAPLANDGRDAIRLTKDNMFAEMTPTFSRDGSRLFFARSRNNRGSVSQACGRSVISGPAAPTVPTCAV